MASRKRTEDEEGGGCCYVEGMTLLPKEVEEALQRAGGLDGLLSRIPDKAEIEERANLHNALSDPIRLHILYALEGSNLCPCVLKRMTGLSDSRLSYHLNVLESAGLVSSSSRRRWRIYYLTEKGRSWLSSGK
jgi:ArsR family transcriptional regulator